MIEKSGKIFLTVREFAQKAGVSNQAIYKQTKNQLSIYVSIIDNQKFIDSKALIDVFGIDVDNLVDNQVVNQKINAEKTAAAADQQQNQSDVSKELLEMLKEEIKKKDQQIEKLQESLDKAYTQISEMAQKAQYITAADKTEKIMMQQANDKGVDPAADSNNDIDVKEEPKKSFWQRLFKK